MNINMVETVESSPSTSRALENSGEHRVESEDEERGHERQPDEEANAGSKFTAEHKFGFFAIALNSLLRQFSSPSIRADFVNGLFGSNFHPDLLNSIDELRCLLTPWWTGGSLLSSDVRRLEACDFISNLIKKKDSILKLPSAKPLYSYGDWFHILDQLATAKYWEELNKTEHCVHNEESEYSDDYNHLERGKNKRQIVNGKIKSEKLVVAKKKKNIEEIIVLSSDDESSGESLPSVQHSESSSSTSTGRKKRHGRSKRKVVVPPVFCMDGKSSLSSFFAVFEQYFAHKYTGTEYDRTQLLGDFLEGKLLDVYKIKGGRKLKYKNMKQNLKTWYDKQKVGSRNFWRSQLETATIGEGEAVDIFGLRLTELAELAYPSSKAEGAKYLRKYFMRNLNTRVVEKLIDMERTMYASNKREKHMSFNNLVEMACKIAKDCRSEVTISWTRPKQMFPNSKYSDHQANYSDHQAKYSDHQAKYSGHQDKYSDHQAKDSSTTSSLTFGRTTDKRCYYCKRTGHVRKDCWRASKSCLICGNDHHMEKCPKYKQNYKKQSMPEGRNLN
jgi:hypothetical protein